MKIQPGNVETYHKRKDELVNGAAQCNDLIAVEYTSTSQKKERCAIVANKANKMVWHTCTAVKKNVPCWHLGAIAHLCGWAVPQSVDIESGLDLNGYVWQDITPMHFGGKEGSFRILDIGRKAKAPEWPVNPVGLSEGDAWLKKYSLPAKLLDKVLKFRVEQRSRLTPEQVGRIPKPRYIPSGNELVTALAPLLYGEEYQWEATLLIGPKSSGKSTLVEALAAILHLPLRDVNGGVDVNLERLLGGKTLVPDDRSVGMLTEAKLRAAAKQAGIEVEGVLQKLRGSQLKVDYASGILLQAIQAGEMVVIDEVNMVCPDVTSILHGLLDWRKTLSVPDFGSVKADPSFRLVACCNYGYAGTKEMNAAFKDRFRPVQVPYVPPHVLPEILENEAECDRKSAKILADLFIKLISRVENGDISEDILSIRSLIRAVREYQDGLGDLREVTVSNLTSGLSDRYEIDAVRDVVESLIA